MTQENKTIVITGGHGFIGSRFIKCVYETTNFNIINIDKNTYAADPERIPKSIRMDDERYTFVEMCITDYFPNCEEAFKERLLSAEYVVNFAAETHVDNSIANGRPFIHSNIEGVLNLLEFFKHSKTLLKYVQISTDEVYVDMDDLRGKPASNETFRLRPSSYYSASKASADLLVQSSARTFGIPYIITRSCNNFGPNQDAEKFIPKVFECIKNGGSVPVYGDGLQTREWIHVDDNVQDILKLTMSMHTNQVFNIGSGYLYKNIQVLMKIGLALGTEVKTEFVKDRLGHDKLYKLDCSKLRSMLYTRTYRPLEGFLKDEVDAITRG